MSFAEIDQSGRTDVLTTDTVLSLSNDVRRTLQIRKATKRAFHDRLRGQGMSGTLIGIRLFSAGLVLLLDRCLAQVDGVTIDREYDGHEARIKGHVLRHLRRRGHTIDKRFLGFGQIGKKSPAHQLAWQTYRGQVQPDWEAQLEEVFEASKP